MATDGGAGRASAGAERSEADRQLEELTGELRVLLAVATVVFAFLLTVPFTARFAELSELDRGAYFVAFLATALALVMFLGEVAYHRLRGKPYDKEQLVTTASRQAVTGIVLVAVAMTAVVFLVVDVLYSATAAAVTGGAVLAVALVTWFALPLARETRARLARRKEEDDDGAQQERQRARREADPDDALGEPVPGRRAAGDGRGA